MSFKTLSRAPPLRWTLYRLARWRVQEKLQEVMPYLQTSDRVLDTGAGNCVLCEQLRLRGYNVVALDLANLSFVRHVEPIVYDGERMPFDDESFEVAMVITVLHHARNPDAVLAELRRVAKRVIVIEEIYENSFEKYCTYAVDSLFNLEFFNHPRSNRTDAGWRSAFLSLGFDVDAARYSRSLGVLRRVTYHLVKT